MEITVYTFYDADDAEVGDRHRTQDYQEARKYAQQYQYKVIANTYEWAGQEEVDDFTEPEDDDEQEEASEP